MQRVSFPKSSIGFVRKQERIKRPEQLTILKGDFDAMADDASAAKEAKDHGDSSTRRGSKEQFATDTMELMVAKECFVLL